MKKFLLTTSLTLASALMACSTPNATTPPTTITPAGNQAQGAPASQPGAPTVVTAASLSGQAMLSPTAPMANATLNAYAPGGSTVLATVTTDASGNFNLPLAGVTAPLLVLVASANHQTLASVVSTATLQPKAFRVLGTTSTSLTPSTTLAYLALKQQLGILSQVTLTPAQSASLVSAFDGLVYGANLAFSTPTVATLQAAVLSALNSQGQGDLSSGDASTLTAASAPFASLFGATATTIAGVLNQAVSQGNQTITPALQAQINAGSTFGATVSNGGGSGGGGSSGPTLSPAQAVAVNAINSVTVGGASGAAEAALLNSLAANVATLGLNTPPAAPYRVLSVGRGDWDQMLMLSAYVKPNPTPLLVTTSGRQQAVADYLLQRINERKTGGVANYSTLAALQADFHYAVAKETAKWNLICDLATDKAGSTPTASAVVDLTNELPAIQTDFNNYLTWHAEWTTPGTPWGVKYFSDNAANMGTFAALSSTDKTAVATAVLASSNGVSDMRIYKGLLNGLIGNINTVGANTDANEQTVMTLLQTQQTTLGITTADWNQFLEFSSYTNPNGGAFSLTSGRQKAVAAYLLQKINETTFPSSLAYNGYGTPAALTADFHYAVQKETNKWKLICDIATDKATPATATASAVVDLANDLPPIQKDFTNYLTWHAEWITSPVVNPWDSAYFAINAAKMSAFVGLPDKTASAANVVTSSTGNSDMAIYKGLFP